jgi:hypothetical protein
MKTAKQGVRRAPRSARECWRLLQSVRPQPLPAPEVFAGTPTRHMSIPPDTRVVIHDDNWHWGPRDRFVFREPEGRGCWRGDGWREW